MFIYIKMYICTYTMYNSTVQNFHHSEGLPDKGAFMTLPCTEYYAGLLF